jgi:hypothetical protein
VAHLDEVDILFRLAELAAYDARLKHSPAELEDGLPHVSLVEDPDDAQPATLSFHSWGLKLFVGSFLIISPLLKKGSARVWVVMGVLKKKLRTYGYPKSSQMRGRVPAGTTVHVPADHKDIAFVEHDIFRKSGCAVVVDSSSEPAGAACFLRSAFLFS